MCNRRLGYRLAGLVLTIGLVAVFSFWSPFSAATSKSGLLLQSYQSREWYATTASGGIELALCQPRTGLAAGTEVWNPYPIYGGEMTAIGMGPAILQGSAYLETVYVGTRDAGIFKTIDGGQAWQPARAGLTFFPIRSIVVNPQDQDVLYAGTSFDGIWKSADGGGSWFKSSSGLDERLNVFNVLIDPQNTDTLYAGLGGGMSLTAGHIFKSQDGGATWLIKDDGISHHPGTEHPTAILSLAMDPANSALLYAGTNYDGVYMTTNGADTWVALNEGLPYREGSTEYRERVNALAVDPHQSNRPGAIVGGEYYIFDAGAWSKVSLDGERANSPLGPGHLYYHPSDSTVLYSAGDGFARSNDAGLTWEADWNSVVYSQVPDVAFHTLSPDTIYAATNVTAQSLGGVYKSDDQGESWIEASQGILAGIIRSVAVDPQHVDNIYAGDAAGHFYRTDDGGATWLDSRVNPVSSSEITDIAVDPLRSLHIYVAAWPFFHRSTDGGESWEKIDQVESAYVIAIAPQASDPIYVGTWGKGIYQSLDAGATWEQRNQGFPEPPSCGGLCSVLALTIDPNDTETVWAGTRHGGGIIRTSNGGKSWQVMGLTDTLMVDAIAVNPRDSNEILVGGGSSAGSIYKSIDGGMTWQEKIRDIAFVQDIVYDSRNSDWVYAATEGYGVLRSFNGGETWHNYSAGLFYPVLYSLAITDEEPPLLVAGSYSSGLYWIHPDVPTLVFLPLVVR